MFDVYNFCRKDTKNTHNMQIICRLFIWLYIYLTCKHFAGYYLGQRYDLWFVRWSSKIGQQT